MLRPGPAGRAAPQSPPPVPAAITGAGTGERTGQRGRRRQLFNAGIHDHSTERPVVPPSRNLFARIGTRWRLAIAVGLAAGLVAAVLPSGPPPVLTAKLLADRPSAAALAGPTVPSAVSLWPADAGCRRSGGQQLAGS